MEEATAGDPMTGRKWSRKSTRRVSQELNAKGIRVSATTVRSMLKSMKYSLKCNRKEVAETHHPDRDRQFGIIGETKQRFESLGQPVISADTKKKERVGNFKNPGRTWCKEPERVLVHDFDTQAVGKAIPYGVWEAATKQGTVVVGTSHDTPEFAVEAIELWLVASGWNLNPGLKQLFILCDAGGSNGYRVRAWKYWLHVRICRSYGIPVTVCHYPPGASKFNPIERRLFSAISQNWAGVPLRSYDVVLDYIRGTTTTTGLTAEAFLQDKKYETGIKITKAQIKQIPIEYHQPLPNWNYTISP